MRSVVFRPRIGPQVLLAVTLTIVVYVVLKWGGAELAYPFGVAGAIGGLTLAWNLLGAHRKHGLVVDDDGIRDVHAGVTIRWADVTEIRLDVERIPAPKGEVIARVVTLIAGDRKIRFADLGPGRPSAAIVNLEAAGLVLAIAAARTRATALWPAGWSAPAAPAEGAPTLPPATLRLAATNLAGVAALVLKVGPKIAAIAAKLLKTIKLGSVAVAIGAYSLIWSPEFAFALVGMILVHECGHVFAMWRAGVQVKGIYFIPFFGGAAVSQGLAKTRARSAYIAINGPIWGTLLALACLAAFAAGDGQRPFLGTLAAWGALINLFNLLPIFPLDGGRIIASLAHASPRGVPIVVATLVLGAVIAYVAQLELLLLVGILGVFELGGRLAAATYGPAIELLDGKPLGSEEHEQLARHVAHVEPERDAPSRVEQRRQLFTHRMAEAAQTPMSFAQGGAVLAGYAVVIGVLIAILVVTTDIAGAGNPLDLLR